MLGSCTKEMWVECLPKGIEDKKSKFSQAFDLIEQIFAADKGFESMPAEEIYQKRKEIIELLLKKYWNLLDEINETGGSNLAKSKTYSINQKKELSAVLLNGKLELTNNLAERAIKPFVIGRKNWLFSDTDKGADASAKCYSIVESAKLNNLNVFNYLTYLLTELPKLGAEPTAELIDNLLPWSD